MIKRVGWAWSIKSAQALVQDTNLHIRPMISQGVIGYAIVTQDSPMGGLIF